MIGQIITADVVRDITPIRGSVSADFINPCIIRAQDLKMSYVVGYKLLARLISVANGGADTVDGRYQALIDEFVRPYLAWETAFYLLPDVAIKIGASGVQEGTSAQGNPIFEGTMALIRQNILNASGGYKKLLKDHLCIDSSKYPEYQEYEMGRQSKTDTGKPFYGVENY